MMEPKISVVFPIYNNEKYLERCIRSVMNQSLREIEMILIDDGSKDSAPSICDKLSAEDDRIIVIHKANEGSAAGRNQGISLACGEYIAFVESDDYVSKNMYEKLYLRAKETNADIVKCGFYFCEENALNEATYFYGVAEEKEVFQAKDRPRIMMNHASIWAGIYRRNFINENELRCIVTPSATYSDFSWMTMTMAYAERITVLHAPLYFYTYDNPNSSRVQEGKKCYYKPFHCKEANRILREAGIFEYVKEEVGYHEYRACLGHARRIKPELRNEYFEKLRDLFIDLTKDSFMFKKFLPWEKLTVSFIIKNKPNRFYWLVETEDRIMNFMHINGFTKKILWKVKSMKASIT